MTAWARMLGASGGGKMTWIVSIVAALVALAAIGIVLPYARRALLGWYVREVHRTEVAETPDEAIVTYPLA